MASINNKENYDLFTAPVKIPSRNDRVSQQIRNKLGDYDIVAKSVIDLLPEDSISSLYGNNMNFKYNFNNNKISNFNNVSNQDSQPLLKSGLKKSNNVQQLSTEAVPTINNVNPNTKSHIDLNSKINTNQKRDHSRDSSKSFSKDMLKLNHRLNKPPVKNTAVILGTVSKNHNQQPKENISKQNIAVVSSNLNEILNEMIVVPPVVSAIANNIPNPEPKSMKNNESIDKKNRTKDNVVSNVSSNPVFSEMIESRLPLAPFLTVSKTEGNMNPSLDSNSVNVAIPSALNSESKNTVKTTMPSSLVKLDEMIEIRPPISAIPVTPTKDFKKLEITRTSASQKKHCRRLSSIRLSADLREDLRMSDESDDNDSNVNVNKLDKNKSSDNIIQKCNSIKSHSEVQKLPKTTVPSLPAKSSSLSSSTTIQLPSQLPVASSKKATISSCSDSLTDSESSSDDSDDSQELQGYTKTDKSLVVAKSPVSIPVQTHVKNEIESKPRWNLGSYLDKNLFPSNEAQKLENKYDNTDKKMEISNQNKSNSKSNSKSLMKLKSSPTTVLDNKKMSIKNNSSAIMTTTTMLSVTTTTVMTTSSSLSLSSSKRKKSESVNRKELGQVKKSVLNNVIDDSSQSEIEDNNNGSDKLYRSSKHRHKKYKMDNSEKKSRGRPPRKKCRLSSVSSSSSSSSSSLSSASDTDTNFNSIARATNTLNNERKFNRPVVTVRPLSPQQSSISSNSDDESCMSFAKKQSQNVTANDNEVFQKPHAVLDNFNVHSNNDRKLYQNRSEVVSNNIGSQKRMKSTKEVTFPSQSQLVVAAASDNNRIAENTMNNKLIVRSNDTTSINKDKKHASPVQKSTKRNLLKTTCSENNNAKLNDCKKLDKITVVKDKKKSYTLRKLFTPKKDSDGGKVGGKSGKVEVIIIDKKDSQTSSNNNVTNNDNHVSNAKELSRNVVNELFMCSIDLRILPSIYNAIMNKSQTDCALNNQFSDELNKKNGNKDDVDNVTSGGSNVVTVSSAAVAETITATTTSVVINDSSKRKRRASESSMGSISPAELTNDRLIDEVNVCKKVNRANLIDDATNVPFDPNEINMFTSSTHDRFLAYHQTNNLDSLRPLATSFVTSAPHSFLNVNYCDKAFSSAAYAPFLMQSPVGIRSYYSYFERVNDDLPDNDLDHNDYLSEAKRLKHTANYESDDTAQVMQYLEAVLGFLMAGSALERDSVTDKSAFTMYKDTLNLIKFISTKFKCYQEMTSIQNKLAILSLRTQALLHLKLYKMQTFNSREIQRVCNNFFKCNLIAPIPLDINYPIISSSSSSASPSPSSPTPSPYSSNSQSSGYVSCSINDLKTQQSSTTIPASNISFMPVPITIFNALQKQNTIFSYLFSCHELWNEADQLVYKCDNRDFFIGLDRICRPLTLHSSLFDLIRYVKLGIRVLREARS